MLPNTSATVINKYVDTSSDETTYYRTIIPAVHWEDGVSVSGKSKNHAESRTAFISIDFSVCERMEKQFVPAPQFALLTASEREQYWTLTCDDIIVKGSVAADIPQRGIRQWLAEHPEASSITTVDTFDMGSNSMKHWEVYAK